MKSVIKIAVVVLVVAFVAASCKSSNVCPAYSKAAKVEQKMKS